MQTSRCNLRRVTRPLPCNLRSDYKGKVSELTQRCLLWMVKGSYIWEWNAPEPCAGPTRTGQDVRQRGQDDPSVNLIDIFFPQVHSGGPFIEKSTPRVRLRRTAQAQMCQTMRRSPRRASKFLVVYRSIGPAAPGTTASKYLTVGVVPRGSVGVDQGRGGLRRV
jgi:hypothetical protein